MKKSKVKQVIRETLEDLQVNDIIQLSPEEDKIKLSNAWWRKGTRVKVTVAPKPNDKMVQIRLPNGADVKINKSDLSGIDPVVEESLTSIANEILLGQSI